MPLTIFGEHDADTVEQLERCVSAVEGARGVLCADGHLGYSQPIGGVVAYPEHISPSGVGMDIGCGNKAVRTNLRVEDVVGAGGLSGYPRAARELRSSEGLGSQSRNEAPVRAYPRAESALAGIMDEITRRISFGMGRSNLEPVADHEVLDRIREAAFEPQRDLLDLAARQLGTVGAGNHYVDLFVDEADAVWIGVHFGSRGFGHKTASGFLALAQGRAFDAHAQEGEMRSPPVLFETSSELGQAYIEAMTLAGAYAYAGRDWVCAKVLEILGAEAELEVHNHHNFAWRERHFGVDFWVVRKGATPARPGQVGFVGSTMGDESVILEGVEGEAAERSLYSTVHGAGRRLSRTQAAGKMRNVFECTERNCDFSVPRHEYLAKQEAAPQHERFTLCPEHPGGRMRKSRKRMGGAIDWPSVQRELRERGIVLRGGAADEAPGVYKDLPTVLAAHEGTIRVLHTLRPVGVAMAGADVVDPFKD